MPKLFYLNKSHRRNAEELQMYIVLIIYIVHAIFCRLNAKGVRKESEVWGSNG